MQIDDKKFKEMEAKAAAYEKMKAINKRSYERRNAERAIILEKAEKAGIKCSEAEIDARLKALGK